MSRPQYAPSEKTRLAAIDVGSNSIHVSIVEVDENGRMKVLDSAKDQTRLGSALDERQCLNADVLARVTPVIKRMKDMADSYGAEIRAVGTHALREAKNGMDFCYRLKKRTGVMVDIISGHEEARLVYLAIQNALPLQEKSTLVVDIGGGSMEMLVGQRGEESFGTSLKLGCVLLTKNYLKSDPYTDSDLKELNRYINSRLEPVILEVQRVGFVNAVGTSGTVKAVKAVALGLQKKNMGSLHGERLTADEIRMVKEAVEKTRSVKDRKLVPGLDPKRADVILAGVQVLDAVTRLAGIESWTISLSAIREGVIIDTLMRKEMWQQGDTSDVRWRAVRSYAQKLKVDESHAVHISTLAVGLFDQLQKRHKLGPTWRELLRAAAYLHESGLFLGHSAFHKHGFYLIRHSGLFGFTIREMDAIACMVRYHRKRLARRDDEVYTEFEDSEKRAIDACAAVLRLAASLDRRREGRIQEIRLSEVGKKCYMEFYLRGSQDLSIEMYDLEIEKKLFEKVFDLNIEVGAAHMSFVKR